MRNLIPALIHERHQAGRTYGRFTAASLLVDISGFTPLTETLMQHQKDGAEVLTAALNGVFEPIVREVYAQGGLITTFAGDAFTALFPLRRPAAAQRAAQAALAIQRFFAERGTARTRYGDFSLGARVGLGLGEAQWGILGRAGRHTYFFRGPAVAGCARAVEQAASGDILADAALAARLGDRMVLESAGAWARLLDVPTPRPPLRPRLPVLERVALAPFVLDAVVDLAAPAEFRDVASLFISFQEPARTAQLNAFVTRVLEQALNYGGYLNKLDFGDKGPVILVFFGAPVAYENDLARAADLVLALQQEALGVRWRAGLTWGTVYAGFVGGVERCEYTVIGDAVNLAARLMAQAEWGSVWTTAEAGSRLAQRGYRIEPCGDVPVKGKRSPVAVARLAGRATVAQARFQGALVGRARELEQLTALVRPIHEGRFGGMVYLYGEAGAGKSRLLHELRLTLSSLPAAGGRGEGVRWFTCPADETLRQSLNPYKHFLRHYLDQSPDRSPGENAARFQAVLDRLAGELRGLGTAAAHELLREMDRTRPFLAGLVDLRQEGSLYEKLEPRLRFDNTLAAFKALCKAESLRRPLVVCIEDAHWLDADSQTLIQSLVRSVEGYPFVVLLAGRYRDDGQPFVVEVGPGVSQQALHLAPLPAASLAEVAAQVLGGPVTARVTALLADKAAGNPFFVEQLALDLRERGALRQEAGQQWDLRPDYRAHVPGNINAVLVARLDRLAGQVRAVVQTAAVLGQEFEVRILSQMLHDPQLPDKVHQAREAAVWVPLNELRYLFRHALLRDAAYDMQLRSRLQELHAMAAGAIEQLYAEDLSAHLVDLAYHYREAQDTAHERHYARRAGEQAAARFANEEAVAYLGRALDLTPDAAAGDRFDLLLSREQVYDLQGARDVQRRDVEALENLASCLDSPAQRAEAALRRAAFEEATVDYAAAIAAAQEAIAQARAADDPAREAEGWRWWGQSLWQQADYAEARQKLAQARQLARPGSLAGDGRARQAEVESLRGLGMVCSEEGDYAAAREDFEESLRIYRAAGDRRGEGAVLNNLGLLHNAQGDYPRARDYFERSLHIAREIGNRREEGRLLNNLGIVSTYQDEPDQALDWYGRAIQAAREVGDRRCEALALNNLGMVYSARDDRERTMLYYEQARQLAHEIGDRRCESLALNNLGLVFLDQGDFATAQAYLEQALAINRGIGNRPGECMASYNLGLIGINQGRLDSAWGYVEAALQIAREIGDRRMEGYALTDLGSLQTVARQWAAAAASYRAALALRRELGPEVLMIETLAGLAGLALRRGDAAEALLHGAEVWRYLEGGGTCNGMNDPSRVYLVVYRVFQAGGDPRARQVLEAGHGLLMERAAPLSAAERETFLQGVPSNRELLAEWETPGGSPTSWWPDQGP